MRNRIQIALWAALFFIFISAKDHAPQELKWYALRDVKFEDKWSKEYESYIRYPVFSPALKALNNQEVFIKGTSSRSTPKAASTPSRPTPTPPVISAAAAAQRRLCHWFSRPYPRPATKPTTS
jgi:hypothetical protein